MNPPFQTYDGGKGGEGVWQRIISEMPPHRVYFEPFLGNSPIMARKASAQLSIGYDLDESVIVAWRSSSSSSVVDAVRRFWCGDGISAMESREWLGDELVYADPPYLLQSRSCKDRRYRHELCDEESHRRLLRVIQELPCPAMVSCYANQLYSEMLAAWRLIEIPTVNRRGKRTIEQVWCNFPPPIELHDYRWLGANFRERERIHRRQKRWRRRLMSMPGLERAALISSMTAGPARNGDVISPRVIERAGP